VWQKHHRARITTTLAVLSAVVTVAGISVLIAFDNAPGNESHPPLQWPRSSRLANPEFRPELLVFVHALCSCTNATIAELARLEAQSPGRSDSPAITFIVFRPGTDAAADLEWRENSMLQRAAVLRGARFFPDNAGEELKRFHIRTSGTVLLYNRNGRLAFQGGITGSRGHEGDNLGLDALSAALRDPATLVAPGASRGSRVFGCAFGQADDEEPSSGKRRGLWLP
jgi:hypothetical protein